MKIYFRKRKGLKDANISIDGAKRLRIVEADVQESVKQYHTAYMQEKMKEDFENNEMNKKYSFQK